MISLYQENDSVWSFLRKTKIESHIWQELSQSEHHNNLFCRPVRVNCGLVEVITKDFRTRKPVYKYCGKYQQLIGKIHIFRPIYRLCGQVIHGYRLLQCSRANLKFSRWICINCKLILRLADESKILMASVSFTNPYHPKGQQIQIATSITIEVN